MIIQICNGKLFPLFAMSHYFLEANPNSGAIIVIPISAMMIAVTVVTMITAVPVTMITACQCLTDSSCQES
jgi:hypothetical protein